MFDWKRWSEEGIRVPFAFDGVTKLPSVTLFFMYIANLLAILSLIYLHIRSDAFIATCMTVLYAVINTVLYLMRKLQSAKFDLDDKSFELEAGDDQEEKHENNSN